MGFWENADGLGIQFGVQKTNPDMGGMYKTTGTLRVAEVVIDLKSLTTSPVIQSLNTFFPAGTNIFVEEVQIIMDEAAAGGSATLSVGLGYVAAGAATTSVTTRILTAGGSSPTVTSTVTASLPAVTTISDTAFLSAFAN